MKHKGLATILILLGYCIPFTFLAMYGDATYGSMRYYAFMLVGFSLLCWGCIKYHQIYTLLIGNTLSTSISYVFLKMVETTEWIRYFKPYTTMHLLILLSAIALIVQLVAWVFAKSE